MCLFNRNLGSCSLKEKQRPEQPEHAENAPIQGVNPQSDVTPQTVTDCGFGPPNLSVNQLKLCPNPFMVDGTTPKKCL